MNSRAITSALVLIAGLTMGLLVIMQILSGGWNAIGQLFKNLTIASAVLAFIMPKMGFWLLLLTTGYLDMLKRMLVFAGNTNILDVTFVLAMSPLIAAGMFAGVVLRDGLAGELLSNRNLKVLVGVMFLAAALGVTGYYASAGGLGGMRAAANFAGYTTLLYVVPKLFRTKEEVWRLLKIIVILFIPVALYGYVQMARGLTWWEVAYLEAGLSGEQRILKGQDFRCFSTLNSSQNLSKMMSMMLVLAAVIPWFSKKGDDTRSVLSRLFSIALMILFAGAAYASGSRTGWVMALIALLAIWLFRYKALTIAAYAMFFVLVGSLVLSADYLLRSKVLNDWTTTLVRTFNAGGDSALTARLNLATYSARLESMENLKDPDFWTPFGFKLAGRDVQEEGRRTHDIMSKLVAQMGYVPLTLLLVVGALTLRRIHRSIWNNEEDRRLKLLAFGIIVCIVVGGLSATENLSTFPVNTFLYLAGGILVFLMGGYAPKPAVAKVDKPDMSPGGVTPVRRRALPA